MIANNKLTGSIPTELGNAVNITYIFLGKSFVYWKWDKLNFMKRIFIHSFVLLFKIDENNLTGPIPTELGNLKDLISMNLGKSG